MAILLNPVNDLFEIGLCYFCTFVRATGNKDYVPANCSRRISHPESCSIEQNNIFGGL